MARRLLVIWLKRLASDLYLRRNPVAGPFALIQRAGNSDRISCSNAAALNLGLMRGMALADARAIYPDLQTAPADPIAQATGLLRLQRFTMRYAPQVGVDGPDGLVADITGVSHLFGGEAELRDDLHARFERAGFALETAIAQTKGGAWALSRHGGGIIPEGALLERLGPLPITALRLSDATAESLARMGLMRISDLASQPRAPLAKRFGIELLQRLDQLLGSLLEPVSAMALPLQFAANISLPEPIGLTKDVMAGLDRLLERLCAKLAAHHMGARRLRFDLHRVDRATISLDIGLARPMREADRIAALFLKHVEGADSGFGIERLRLEAYVVEPLAPSQIGNATAKTEDDLADLMSRLGNRFGFERITRPHPIESRLPERSFTLIPAAVQAPSQLPIRQGPPRPLVMFKPEPVLNVSGHPPLRFQWRAKPFTTLRAHGPERIAPDWWEDDPAWSKGVRDYWRIETREGPRLWLFYTPLAPSWSAQGAFL